MSKNYTALSIENLTVHYGSTLALFDITCSIPIQKITAIVGPNGAGKSTLIKAILGIEKKAHGTIDLLGAPFHKHQKKVAYVPQRQSIDWQFPITAFEVVMMGGFNRYGWLKRPCAAEREKGEALMKKFGLSDLKNRPIHALSGGQQQRLFLARALMQEAEIYFFDEPFIGVDLGTEKLLIETFQDLKAMGKSLFVVHHDLSTLHEYFDWAILINKRLIACGSLESVLTKDNLKAAYGIQASYFEEILHRSLKQKQGLLP